MVSSTGYFKSECLTKENLKNIYDVDTLFCWPLEHPKVKLFISHGGISGIYEAVDAGVPVLGLPVIFDQNRNIDNLMKSGMALSMKLFFLTKETFLKNILELVNNKK